MFDSSRFGGGKKLQFVKLLSKYIWVCTGHNIYQCKVCGYVITSFNILVASFIITRLIKFELKKGKEDKIQEEGNITNTKLHFSILIIIRK